jgi:ribosomal protein S18 acetylase RimI-like enzyme
MIEYRHAEPLDAPAIANLHARSWRENYRGAYHDAFLDGDLPGERLRVWRARLDCPANNQVVQVAVDGPNLVGFVCAYAAHDPQWGSLIDNLHVAHEFKRYGIGLALITRAAAWLATRCPDLGVYLLVLEVNASAVRFLRAPRWPERRRVHHGNSRRRRRAQLPVHVAPAGAALSCLARRCHASARLAMICTLDEPLGHR